LHSWAIAQFVLTFILLVLSIAIAPRRRRAVVWLGAGTVVALIIGRVLLRNLRDSLLGTIHSFEARNAAKSVFVQLGGSLKHTALIVGWIAVLIALVAYLAGKPAWLMSVIAWVKRLTAPQDGGSDLERGVAAHPDIARVVAAVVALYALFRTGIDWVPVIVIGGLLALFMWWVAAAQHKVDGRDSVA
jgi:flagellar biosynthesis component FlhA